MKQAGRPRGGHVVKRWRKRDQQHHYALRIMVRGERHWVPLGTEVEGWNDKRAAAELASVCQQIEAGIWQPPAAVGQLELDSKDPTFHEYASWWLEDRRPEISPATYDDYRNLLVTHLLPFFKNYPLTHITYELVARYRRERLAEGKRRAAASAHGIVLYGAEGGRLRPIGARQINASIALLKRILRRAARSNVIALERVPDLDHDLRVRQPPRSARRHLEADEVLTLLDAASALDAGMQPGTLLRVEQVRHLRDVEGLPWQEIGRRIGKAGTTAIYLYQRASSPVIGGRRALVAVLACSGLRNAEAAVLRRRHLDLTHDRIVIPEAKTPQGVREVWMSPFLRAELAAYAATIDSAGDALLFPTRRGNQRTRQNVGRNIVARSVAEANRARAATGHNLLPDGVTAHTLRRTYVTLCAQAGWSLGFVVKQVGHTDANTTNRFYIQASAAEISGELRGLAIRLVGQPGVQGG